MPELPLWLCRPAVERIRRAVPAREMFLPNPWGCHRRRISGRIMFDKLAQVVRFGCSYDAIADTTCSATTLRPVPRRGDHARRLFAALARDRPPGL